jgi:hypothetical protein
MLVSLLPGLRDLRTPLATGYLYFLLAWAALGRDRVLPEAPNRFLARLFDLSTILGTSVTIASLSFAAYLLGSILVIREVPWIGSFLAVPWNMARKVVKRYPQLRGFLAEKILDRRVVRTFPVLRTLVSRLVNGQPTWSRSDVRFNNWIENQIRLLAVRGWGIRELTSADRVPDVFRRWAADIYEHTFLTPDSVPEWLTTPEAVAGGEGKSSSGRCLSTGGGYGTGSSLDPDADRA